MKLGCHSVYYTGTMPRFVRAKTVFFGIILCSSMNFLSLFLALADSMMMMVLYTINWIYGINMEIKTLGFTFKDIFCRLCKKLI